MLHTYGVNIKNAVILKTSLKNFDVDRVKEKPEMLPFEEIKEGLAALLNETSNRILSCVAGKCCLLNAIECENNLF